MRDVFHGPPSSACEAAPTPCSSPRRYRCHPQRRDTVTPAQRLRSTKRMQATARRLSVVSATSCARRRLIRDVRPGGRVHPHMKMFAIIIAGGWDYGDTTGFAAAWVVLVFLMITLVPLASVTGYYHHGWLAYVQLPLIVCIVAWLAVLLIRRGSRHPILKLGAMHVSLCLVTNIMAFGSRIDHSKDFQVTDRMMTLSKTETVKGVIEAFGTPMEDSEMAICTRPIPRVVLWALEGAQIESARVLRYEEVSQWRDCTTCFLVFDPATQHLITVVRHYAGPGEDRAVPCELF